MSVADWVELCLPDERGPAPIRADDGRVLDELQVTRLDWTCADAPLRALVLSLDSRAAPEPEATEPVAGALARLLQAFPLPEALICLVNPAQALGEARIGWAQGVRLLGIGSDADEAVWDAALSAGQICYGMRGTLRCRLHGQRRDAAAVLLALAYGSFLCCEGLVPERFEEERAAVQWRIAGAQPRASVIVRGGFEAACLDGSEGCWQDRGQEAYVRLLLQSSCGRCWSQPRLVLPRAGDAS